MKKFILLVLTFTLFNYSFSQCGNVLAPYLQNFDNSFPVCWLQDSTEDFDWTLNSGPPPTLQNGFQTGPSDDITGGGSYIYTEATPQDQGDQAILYSDSIDISSLTNPQLNFYYHMYGDDMGDLDIEIYNGNNYVNIFSISGDQGNQWIKDSIPIYSSSNIIIFRITGTIGDGWSSDMAIDNFEITEGPTCPAPSFLTSSNITSNSAEISWSASTNANSWIINYNGNSLTTSSNPTILNNLNPITAYSVIVSSICPNNDTSYNSSPISFTTNCLARIAPFTENFDSIFPICWSQEDVLDDFDWTLNSGPPPSLQNGFQTGPSDDVTGGGNYMYTEASAPRDDGDIAIMYSENIDISTLTNPELNFYYHMYGSAIGDLNIDLYDGNNYVTIFSISGDQGNQWIQKRIPFGMAGLPLTTIKFRITATLSENSDGDTWPGDIAIDNFEVRESPTCPEVLYHTVYTSNSTISSTEIDWTAGGSETSWNIEYGPLGFTQGTGTTVFSLTSNPYTLNGLNSSSSYDFYIQALCSVGDLSLWSGPYSFSTSCGAISAPYLQNFDNSFPVCWIQDSTDEFDWTINSGATPSNQFGTGPTDDITGGGNYIYRSL